MSNPYSGYGNGNYGGYGNNGGGYNSNSPYRSSGASYGQFTSLRAAHGVLASLAFLLFFPAGAIIIRLLPSKYTVVIHATCQIVGYLLFTVAFGLGVYIARSVNFGSFSLINQAHPIIGIVVWVLLIFQPILGLLHHRYFKKYKRRTFWSYAHLWLGRIVITLGIVNGALGLDLANNSQSGLIAYSVIAAVVWIAWLGAAIYGEITRRHKAVPDHPPAYQDSIPMAAQQSYGYNYRADHPGHSGDSSRTQVSDTQQGLPEYYGKVGTR